MINVLLTSVGRRSYLVDYFRQALHGNGKVVCANMYADAPGMYVADEAVVVPASNDPDYVPAILELCHAHQINIICSLHDLDVYILSQHVDELRQLGVVPILPDAAWGRLALDKYECTRFLETHGFAVPWTTLNLRTALDAIEHGQLDFPVIVKARMGFGSLGLHYCTNADELTWTYEVVGRQIDSLATSQFLSMPRAESVLIQKAILGAEYCIDIVNDLTGKYVCNFICEVHAMRAGESDRATTLAPDSAGDLPKRLSALTRHVGIWEVDCMNDNGLLRIIDVNPRFTGDYPFHHIAGANIPAAIIAWVKGVPPEPRWFKPEIGVSGYKDLVPKRGEH